MKSFLNLLPQKYIDLFVASKIRIWVAAALIAGFMAIYWDATTPPTGKENSKMDIENASTYIPAGFVLVPIEVANFESLDSILGQFGIVDLYAQTDEQSKQIKKVADHIKILRAPLNPSHFAVLATEAESPRLVAHGGPFTVVVQNPNVAGTTIDKSHSKERADEAVKNSDPKKPERSRITVEARDGNDS